MNEIYRLPQAPSCEIPSLTPQAVGLPVRLTHSPSFARYLRHAVQTLIEFDLIAPGEDRLGLIVEAALAAQAMLFTVSLHDPDPVELHKFFESFILTCVIPPEKRTTL